MTRKIRSIVIALLLLIVILFLGSRYSWKLCGFRYCIDPSTVYVESVIPGKGCYEIKGNVMDSISSFVGYTYKIEEQNIYIGLKYNTFLGFFKRDSVFDIKIDCDTSGEKYNIYIVDWKNEKLIW